jgi:hypothetical protein
VSAIIQKCAAGSFVMSVPDPADEVFPEGLRAGPDGGWQQTAGIFSAIATMISLTAHDADRQSREKLIRQLDELETTVRNGAAEDSGRLKVELARLEAELRGWRGITGGPGIVGGGAAAPGVEAGEGAGNNSTASHGMFRNRLLSVLRRRTGPCPWPGAKNSQIESRGSKPRTSNSRRGLKQGCSARRMRQTRSRI